MSCVTAHILRVLTRWCTEKATILQHQPNTLAAIDRLALDLPQATSTSLHLPEQVSTDSPSNLSSIHTRRCHTIGHMSALHLPSAFCVASRYAQLTSAFTLCSCQ